MTKVFSTEAHDAYQALKATCREQVKKIEALEQQVESSQAHALELTLQLNDRNETIQLLSRENDALLQEVHSIWQMTGSPHDET